MKVLLLFMEVRIQCSLATPVDPELSTYRSFFKKTLMCYFANTIELEKN